MKIEILRTSGFREVHEIDVKRGDDVFPTIYLMINAECLGVVNLRDGRVMLVDDNGWECQAIEKDYGVQLVPTRARKPLNKEATKLYHSICVPGTTHSIVGDVAIMADADLE